MELDGDGKKERKLFIINERLFANDYPTSFLQLPYTLTLDSSDKSRLCVILMYILYK